MKNLLTGDIKGRIYTSYGARQRCSKSRPAQSGSHLLREHSSLPEAAERLARNWSVTKRQAYRYLQRLSNSNDPFRWKTPRCLLRSTFSPFSGEAPNVRRLHRMDLERDRQPSGAVGPASWGRPWLTVRQVGNARCGWIINLIGCGQRNWPKFMHAWCPTRSHSHLRQLPLAGEQAGDSE